MSQRKLQCPSSTLEVRQGSATTDGWTIMSSLYGLIVTGPDVVAALVSSVGSVTWPPQATANSNGKARSLLIGSLQTRSSDGAEYGSSDAVLPGVISATWNHVGALVPFRYEPSHLRAKAGRRFISV